MSVEAINEIAMGAVKKEEQPAAPEKTETEIKDGGEKGPEGGAQQQAPESVAAAAKPIEGGEPAPIVKDKLDALMEELGVGSVEELKALKEKATQTQRTPEEKAQDEAIQKKNFELFAVREKLLSSGDFIEHANIMAAQDYDLVFNNFLKEWKEDNEDVIAENQATTEDDIRQLAKLDFETKLKLNSDNAKLKQRGEQKLAAEAEKLRTPAKSKYENALARFNEEEEVRVTLPKFSKATNEIILGLIGKEVEWHKGKDGETEFSVTTEITDAQKKEIADYVAKKLDTPQNYILFRQGKADEIRELAEDLVEAKVSKMFKADAATKIAQAYESIGLKKAQQGSVNSFATVQASASENAKGATSEETVLNFFKGKKQ